MQSFSRDSGWRGKIDAKLLVVGWWNEDAWKNVLAFIGRIWKCDIVYKLENWLVGFINISDY